MNIIQSPSPNRDSRKGYKPEAIVIHITEGNWPTDKEWLQNPQSQVSSHYIIAPTGQIHQLVSDEERAWHAGRYQNYTVPLKKTIWGTVINPNEYTIGIEMSAMPPSNITPSQEESLVDLLQYLGTKWNIPIDRNHVWKHSEIFSLKTCPAPVDIDKIVERINKPSKDSIKKQIIDLLNKL